MQGSFVIAAKKLKAERSRFGKEILFGVVAVGFPYSIQPS